MEVTRYAHGTPSWTDLQTTDVAAAGRFYGELLGWSLSDVPVEGGGTYTMATLRGKAVAGLGGLPPGAAIPPHWNHYVSVDDVDATMGKVQGLGGTVIEQPFDVMTFGRMGVVQDPTGAITALWQPKQHIGAELVNEPGAFCWSELYTRDIDRAATFYGALFGWTTRPMQNPETEMRSFANGDREIATTLRIRDEWGPMPPSWMVYFAVSSCDETVARATKLGGKTFVPPTDIPGVGRFAGLADPQGAHFFAIQLQR